MERPSLPETLRCTIALIAGALYPLALAPFGFWPLGLLSVAGLCLLLRDGSAKPVWWRAFSFGLGMFGVGASWIYVSIHVYGLAPPWLAATLTGLFVSGLALCFALPFIAYGFLPRRHPLVCLLAFPALWLLGEWFRGWFLTGFPWLYLGYGTTDTWLTGWAPILGILGLGWMAVFTATGLSLLPSARFQPVYTAAALALAAALWAGGGLLQSRTWTEPAGEPLTVTLLQPDVPQERRWHSAALAEILAGHRMQTRDHWGSDLIIWPESAVPQLSHRLQRYLSELDERARHHNSALLTGIPTRADGRIHNSVIALGTARGQYHKRHLVPFGEYVPLESWLRGTIDFFDLPMSAFKGGPRDQPLIRVRGHGIATAICYEIVYQDLVSRDAADAGLILTVSNDTWFGASIGPHQHFQMARMRALENGKPVLRATNDGITAIIDSRGQVRDRLPQFSRDTLSGEVVPHSGRTPFNAFGSLPAVIWSWALVLLAFALSRRLGSGQ